MSDEQKEKTALQFLDLIVNGSDDELGRVLEEARMFLESPIDKHPSVLQWRAWLASEDGRRCSEVIGLSGAKSEVYLRNRLWRAWTDGYQVGEKQGAKKSGGISA